MSVSVGSVLQLVCQHCGQANAYKRKVVSVDALNEERRRLEQMLVATDHLLAYYEVGGTIGLSPLVENLRAAAQKARHGR